MSTKLTLTENHFIVRSAKEHRRLLLDGMVALIEGRMSVPVANALSGLSTEVHKSVRLEWDMITYAADNVEIGDGNQVNVVDA